MITENSGIHSMDMLVPDLYFAFVVCVM